MHRLRPLDDDPGRPLYIRIADALRKDIREGVLEPGQQLPAEPVLRHEYAVGKATVAEAMRILRDERLIVTRRGRGNIVRPSADPVIVEVGPGAEVSWRPATERERQQLGAETRWVVVVHAAGNEQIYPAETTIIHTTG